MTALLLLTVLSTPPQQAYRFDVQTQTVYVDVFVGRGAETASRLGAADFEVLDNGVLQEVDLAVAESIPLSVMLVLDTSESVAGDKLWHLRAAGEAVLRALREKDRAALLTFSHKLELNGFDAGVESLQRVILTARAEGGTAVLDGLYAGLQVAARSIGKPLVILFTDGEDTISWLSEAEVLEAAKRSDAVVYAVSIVPSLLSIPSHRLGLAMRQSHVRTGFLRRVTEATGGRLLLEVSSAGLADAFTRALEEMRTRYVLGYRPQGVPDAGWHTLTVRLKHHRADLRARSGYYPTATARP